ncbi:MAG: NADH-quinone oxidoreductase subunit M [Nitrospira sp.]|nr:NADH-quinone oxidoreductase subunit M [Candidatus Manganitrophaceae bacterium]HIL34908.1 NADH-quinone oxidoreductase subunit M [Candidatus Manganitrophaceae bacterium]
MLGTLNQVFASDQIGFPILSLMIFLPLIGAVLIWRLPDKKVMKQVVLGTVSANFLLSLLLLSFFEPGVADMQFVEKLPWIVPMGVNYHVGVDGISLWLLLLSTFLPVLTVLFSWKMDHDHLREYLLCLLGLEFTLIGVFVAIDLILFFLFWEVMLIPMYFLIKIWGGTNRDYASLKFVLYTLVGSVLMLVGFAILALNYHDFAVAQNLPLNYSFSLIDLLKAPVPPEQQILVFILLFFGFAFKVPMVPFHTWLPDAHVEAPTTGSVMLAGLLLKMGTYGFVRFSLPLLPDASRTFVPLISVLAVIGIVYGAWLALAQDDIKKLIAYSSISHLGFVMLGIFTLNHLGIQGGMIQMINHGISTAGLFFIVGFLYERRHTRLISEYGGLAKQVPILAAFYFIISLSSMGMPGTNGFVGEFLILSGAFRADWRYAAVAIGGVVLGAGYLIWLYQRLMYGPLDNPKNKVLLDLDRREVAICIALCGVIFWTGLFPGPFLKRMEGSIAFLTSRTELASIAENQKIPRFSIGPPASKWKQEVVQARPVSLKENTP